MLNQGSLSSTGLSNRDCVMAMSCCCSELASMNLYVTTAGVRPSVVPDHRCLRPLQMDVNRRTKLGVNMEPGDYFLDCDRSIRSRRLAEEAAVQNAHGRGGLGGDGAPVQCAAQADRALAQGAGELGDRVTGIDQRPGSGRGSRWRPPGSAAPGVRGRSGWPAVVPRFLPGCAEVQSAVAEAPGGWCFSGFGRS